MADRPTRARRPGGSTLVIILLAFGSGAVDALSFAALGAVFASVMTGNLVLLGLALIRLRPGPIVETVTAIAGYVAGVLAAAAWLRRTAFGERDPWPVRVVVTLAAVPAVQAAVLAGWLAGAARPSPAAQVMLLALSSFAMGVQSAAVNALPVPGAATTYLTGTLTSLATEMATGGTPVTLRRLAVLGAALAGAALDGLLLTWARPAAPALPLAVTLAVLVVIIARDRPRRS